MFIHVNTHSGTPIYRQVIDQISGQIATGQLSAGEQLDSVAVLSKRLGVNPMTISKAYSHLVQEGLLERRSGIGVFVAAMEREDRQSAGLALLDESMEEPARLASQLGMDERETMERFRKHYQTAVRQNNKKGEQT